MQTLDTLASDDRTAEVAPQAAAAAAVPMESPATAASAAPAPADAPARSARSRRRKPRGGGAAEAGEAMPATEAPAAAAPMPQAAPQGPAALPAGLTPPADGGLFGRWTVEVAGEESAEVTLRAAAPGTELCTCLDFALSEDARCPHVDALHAALRSDPARLAAWQAGPADLACRVAVQHGAQARLLWLPGCDCPPALDELARRLLDAPVPDDAALPRLLRAAREAGQVLHVDEAAWQLLAAARDARWRVHRLESELPQGPASEPLRALTPEPLLPLQLEGALFAVCAGRCILADCAELQPQAQALAAVGLWRRLFGVERVLVLAPAEALAGWRRALGSEPGVALMDLARVADDAALHRELAPELVLVHEAPAGGLWIDAERAAALLRLSAPHAVVLPGAGWLQRPAELPLRVAFVDAARSGSYAALLQRHGRRDDGGALCGLDHLGQLPDTLAAVALMRPLEQVLAQLPERIDRTLGVPLPAAAAPRLAAERQALQQALRRWQRCGWLSDAAQRALLLQLQALRRRCAGDGDDDIAAAKADALRALFDGEAAPAKAVLFSQWLPALQAQQALLPALAPALWCAERPPAERQAALQRFRDDAACRLLLVADAGSAALDLRMPGAAVLHLDVPWNPRQTARRFGRVHRRGTAHLVPNVQLLLADTLEPRLADAAAARPEPVADTPDAQPGDGFLQGEALAAFGADLARLLDLAAEPAA